MGKPNVNSKISIYRNGNVHANLLLNRSDSILSELSNMVTECLI